MEREREKERGGKKTTRCGLSEFLARLLFLLIVCVFPLM